MADADRRRLRAYLLGMAGEDDQTAIEERYFSDGQALEALEAEEEALIEDYLADALPPDERKRFVCVYLEHPERRRHVEVIRGLMNAAQGRPTAASPGRRRAIYAYAPLAAAAAIILILAGLWVRNDDPPASEVVAEAPPVETEAPPVPTPVPSPPRIVAISLLPVAVRGPDAPDSVVQVGNADVIALELQGELAADLVSPRVVISAVGGTEVWSGAARPMSEGRVVTMHAEVPALRLPPEDYFVTLLARDADGDEQERARYVLRVRTP